MLPTGFALVAAALALASFAGADNAEAAVVYCTAPGVPAGCVVRPTPAARATVYCTRPGYPVGCTAGADPAARAVARPGAGVNGGGPVNRAGLR
ncbi:hypothetical protein KHC27_21035 [Ancylobacter lacus]|nr:hypothetical protein [Ancylobacter lacus]